MGKLLATSSKLGSRQAVKPKNVQVPLKVVVIGLGGQTRKDHIPAILRRDDLKIVALVDQDEGILKEYSNMLDVEVFQDTQTALNKTSPDLAVVSVPHNQYFGILELLATKMIPTLKEKPLAMTYSEANQLVRLFEASDTYLQICVQRRFSKLYEATKSLLEEIGNIYSVNVEYALDLNADDMASGWRADRLVSGGGAALDMGYHSIDLLTYIFGSPDKVYAQLSYNSIGAGYSIEDTMKAMMTYGGGKINANVLVTKVSDKRGETVRVSGSKGHVLVDGRTVTLYDKNSNEVESHTFNSKQQEVDAQLDYFVAKGSPGGSFDIEDQNFIDQLNNMHAIDAIYESHANNTVVKLR